ncbi:hypothetical protein [Streptomyces sp. TLI_185]|uniref:hypothetical protein n=1 Tax=Streptomyces sp. TLI_185 TaxID=2485151 RepID=UPI000F4D513F|nr:hypothetical protein [Streptomyces sp. TLI_185]
MARQPNRVNSSRLRAGQKVKKVSSKVDSGVIAGEVIGEFIDRQLIAAREKRDKLEARGVSVVTTSGALVTLQLAFAALLPKEKKVPPVAASVSIGLSMACFLIAAVFAICVNIPKRWLEADPATLAPLLGDPLWGFPALTAKRKVAKVRLEVLRQVEVGLAFKAKCLFAAFVAQLAGIASITAGAVLVLASY